MKKIASVILMLVCVLLFQCKYCIASPSNNYSRANRIIAQGTVVDMNGKPIPKAKVFFELYKNGRPSEIIACANSKGDYKRVICLDSSTFCRNICATADGYSYGSSNFSYSNGRSDCNITLYPGKKLQGKVIDEKGKPIVGVRIDINNCYAYKSNVNVNIDLPYCARSALTDKNGVFTFKNMLDPDKFDEANISVDISKAGYANLIGYFQKNDIKKGIVIKDPLECKLSGTLYLPGKAGTAPKGIDLMLMLNGINGCRFGRSANCDDKGHFCFNELPSGEMTIILNDEHPLYDSAGKPSKYIAPKWAMPAKKLELKSGTTNNVDLVMVPGVLIKGKVVDSKDNSPIKSAYIDVCHNGRPQDSFAENIVSDENGEFESRVVPGNVTFEVNRILNGGQDIYFRNSDTPVVNLMVSESDMNSNVTIKVDKDSANQYDVQNKPVPDDFEITSGTYNLTWDPSKLSNDAYYRYAGQDAISRTKKMPKFVSSRPQVFAYRLDGNEGFLFVAFDESAGTGKGWDTAYIDLNRNGDLTDDTPINFSSTKEGSETYTPWVSMKTHQGDLSGEHTDNPQQIRLSIDSYNKEIYASVERKGAWVGLIKTNKGQVECAALDYNGDGVYGEIGSINENCQPSGQPDEICIDTNGYGSVSTLEWGPHHFLLYNVIRVANKYYNIKINNIGNEVSITPYSGQTGQLEVCGKDIDGWQGIVKSIIVTSKAGSFEISNNKVILPVGRYAINYCVMALQDNDKRTFEMSCEPATKLDVSADKPATAIISGKITMAICPNVKELIFRQNESTVINWDIKIGNDVVVSSIGNNDRNNPPQVRFIDKKGKTIYKTTAGYT